jgi:hypothetical protein
MKLKKSVFPKKTLIKIDEKISTSTPTPMQTPTNSYRAGFSTEQLAGSFPELFKNFGETYMWYFSFFWVVGLISWFKRNSSHITKTLLTLFFFVNIAMMTLLYSSYGYMSDRHSLALFTLTFIFVPIGLKDTAVWLTKKSKPRDAQRSFLIMISIGLLICIPKLLRPIGSDKEIYKEAALWIRDSLPTEDIVAVFDVRIGFYSQKNWTSIKSADFENIDWIVTYSKDNERHVKKANRNNLNLTKTKAFQEDDTAIAIYKTLKQQEPNISSKPKLFIGFEYCSF